MRMTKIFAKWEQVEAIAARLGVKADAVRKWKERGAVPYKWHVRLISASNGKIRLSDFAQSEPAE
jgi:uncharacterized protein YjcR